MLRKKEKEVLGYFSLNALGLSPQPFKQAAVDLRMPEPSLINLLNRLQKKGLIKSLRGLIDHRRAGYCQNALIAWKMNAQAKDARGKLIKDVFLVDDRISHCYLRQPHKAFTYDIFTMMHARTRKEINGFVRRNARAFGLDYEVLFTDKELKKQRLQLGELLC